MKEQDFRVGQTVRISDVREGVVSGVTGTDTAFIDIEGRGWVSTTLSWGTRTITILSEPKPDEPTGLGALVRDAAGEAWVLAEPGDRRQPWRRLGSKGGWRHWDHIDAVEVLFPGVPGEKP